MGWKPEYAESRRRREAANPELKERHLASARESQERNREERKGYMRDYYVKKPEKFPRRTPEQQAEHNARRREKYAADAAYRKAMKEKVKAWQERNPHMRKGQRLRKFNLTLPEFQAMLESQGGKCLICGYSDTSNPKHFPFVDHCHTTGKVRGLLCSNCNHGLGHFKDSVDRLQAAIQYLSDRG